MQEEQRFVKFLPKNKAVRGVMALMTGTMGAQLVAMLSAPVLTRLYEPELFGLLAVFMALLSIVNVLSSLRYEIAIPQPSEDVCAVSLVSLSVGLVFVVALLTLGGVFFLDEWLVLTLSAPGLLPYLWLLPCGVFFVGLYQVFYYWGIRKQHFSKLASTRIKQSLAMTAVQIGAYKFGAVALLAGHVLGQGVGCWYLARDVLRSPELKEINRRSIYSQAKRYVRYPLFSTWSGLLNTTGVQLPSLVISAFFTPAAAGLYIIAHRVVGLPLSVLSGAVGNVFLSNAAAAYREGRLQDMVGRTYQALTHIGMPVMFMLIIGGPDLFEYVFGNQWRDAGIIAQSLAPMFFMMFVTSPLSTLFGIMDKQAQGLIFQALLLLGRVSGLAVGYFYWDSLYVAVLLFSILSVVVYVGFIVWIFLNSNNSIVNLLLVTVRAIGFALIIIIPFAIGIYKFSGSNLWLLFFGISLLGLLFAYAYLYRLWT